MSRDNVWIAKQYTVILAVLPVASCTEQMISTCVQASYPFGNIRRYLIEHATIGDGRPTAKFCDSGVAW